MAEPGKQGFASMDENSMDEKKQRDIGSQGGHASNGSVEKDSERAAEAGQNGGSFSGGTNESLVKTGQRSQKNT